MSPTLPNPHKAAFDSSMLGFLGDKMKPKKRKEEGKKEKRKKEKKERKKKERKKRKKERKKACLC